MRKQFKNVILIILLLLSVQINGDSRTLKVPGCQNMSKNLKNEGFYFVFESTKRKVFEKRQNVLKWIKSIYKWMNDQHADYGWHDDCWHEDGCRHEDSGGRRDDGGQTKERTNKFLRLKFTQFFNSQFLYSQRPKKIEDRPSKVAQTADSFNKNENSSLKNVYPFGRHD